MCRKDTLVTERLVLKSFENKDKEDVIKLLENPLVAKTYMCPVFESEEHKDKFFSRFREISKGKDKLLYGIFLNEKVIGFINEVEKNDEEMELGYVISPNEWNKGYATEALKAVIKELFRIGFKRVVAAHFEINPASGKVMIKGGMQKIDRTEVIEYQGIKHNCVYYAIESK